MNTDTNAVPSAESKGLARAGAPALLVYFTAIASTTAGLIYMGKTGSPEELVAFLAVISGFLALLFLGGFFVIPPNSSRVLVFFGKYRGTIRKEGFYWVRPFMGKKAISLRANNLASETIKVNDLNGNPIEIGTVVVWRVQDTAKASFDVEDYQDYINVQIETAVRELAKTHPYESHMEGDAEEHDEDVISLRSGTEAITKELTSQLQKRLDRAGIEVLEARISHLSYALEIASAMLQRQQAAAIISARKLIVEGAVGMVEHALSDLQGRGVVDLDDERKATMVSNLLVVLCSHAEPTPVINAGGIYN